MRLLLLALATIAAAQDPCGGGDINEFFMVPPEAQQDFRIYFSSEGPTLREEPFFPADIEAQFQQMNRIAEALFQEQHETHASGSFALAITPAELPPQQVPQRSLSQEKWHKRHHRHGDFHAKFHQFCQDDQARFCAEVKGPLATMHCMGKHHDELSDKCKQFMPRYPVLFAVVCLLLHVLVLGGFIWMSYMMLRCMCCSSRTAPEDEFPEGYVPLAEGDEHEEKREIIVTGTPVSFTAEV